MLRFAEEIILLLLNDNDGRFAHVPRWSLDYALAGGVLMDLALENLILVDAAPVDDSLLDPTLADIEAGEKRDARFWVERTANRAHTIHEEALSRLVAQGILERRDDRFLWVFRSRRYPTIGGEVEREVKLRIMGVLFSDEIPHPRVGVRQMTTTSHAASSGDCCPRENWTKHRTASSRCVSLTSSVELCPRRSGI